MSEVTATEAMERANSAHLKIEAHEDLCAERYENIHAGLAGVRKTIDTVLTVLAWGGSTVFGLLMVVLGWLAVRAVTNSDAQFNQMQDQIDHMQQHEQPAVLHLANPVSKVSQTGHTTS